MAENITHKDPSGGHRGRLFTDVKFWVARIVPNRNHVLDLIKTNGGMVVLKAKEADMIIADHSRTDAPDNSTSWQFITESVKEDDVQSPARYRIRSSRAPPKQTKTKFSATDDAALANWIMLHEKDRTGNNVYKEFAESHPRHPWQAWRNRFVKYLSQRSDEELKQLAMSAPDLAARNSGGAVTPKIPAQQMAHNGNPPDSTAANENRPTGTPMIAYSPPAPATADDADNAISRVDLAASETKPVVMSSSGDSEEAGAETQVNMRSKFYQDLFEYVRENGVTIDAQPVVGNKIIDLCDLAQSVASQNMPIDEVHWSRVAEELAYEVEEQTAVSEGLQQCYRRNLAGFFEAMSTHDPYPADEALPDAASNASSIQPSSQGSVTNLKRLRHSPPSTHHSAKRRRLSRSAEIPSTPDSKLHPANAESPIEQRQLEIEQAEEDATIHNTPSASPIEEQDSGDIAAEALSNTRKAGTPPPLDSSQSIKNVTPSQLTPEVLGTTPIPLELRPRSSSDKTNVAAQAARTGLIATKRSLPQSFRVPAASASTSPILPELTNKPQRPSRPIRIEAPNEAAFQDISQCVEYYESLGYSRRVVMKSLACTTLTPGWPATKVMEKLQAKEPIPNDIEGVWTARDDERLRLADAVEARKSTSLISEQELVNAERGMKWLVKKHTQQGVDLRRQFLA